MVPSGDGRPLAPVPEQVRSYAAKAAGLSPEPAEAASAAPASALASASAGRARAARSSALDYLRGLRAEGAAAAAPPAAGAEAPLAQMAAAAPPAPSGFEALERRLAGGRAEPARKARAEAWLRIPVTPDVELAVRGRPDAEQRARLERCADLIRDILLGRNP